MSTEIKILDTPMNSSAAASTIGTETTLWKGDVEGAPSKDTSSFWQYLLADVDAEETTWQLTAYCFMTGYIDVVSFSAIFGWCGLQTGNLAQLALALARLFEGPPGQRDQSFHGVDQQSLTSFLSFGIGSCLGRLSDRIGAHKRIWLIGGTFLQALFTMASAVAFWKAGQPGIADQRDDSSWTNTLSFVGLAFMSASLGLQGILAKRLNTQFGTTLVLTTIWIDLTTEPDLFKVGKVKTRDHKVIAAGALFFGAFVGRAILGQITTAGTLGIAVGLRVLISLSWLFVPSKTTWS